VAGRKQYIYSEAAVAARDRRKWDRVLAYARVLPRLREVTNEHLRRGPGPGEGAGHGGPAHEPGVLPGGQRAVRGGQNRTFGIATLKKRHLEVRGNDLVFTYVGKRKKDHRRVVADTPLVEILRSC
jgi:DNA topoisomerase I